MLCEPECEESEWMTFAVRAYIAQPNARDTAKLACKGFDDNRDISGMLGRA